MTVSFAGNIHFPETGIDEYLKICLLNKIVDANPIIGVIEGGGTGPELAKVFEKVVSTLYEKESGNDLEFLSFEKLFSYNPHTFWELKKNYNLESYHSIKNTCNKEVKDILQFIDILSNKGGKGIFRTAVNAETLYYLRRDLKKIKVLPLKIKKDDKEIEILFIRDQIQGYYTNDDIKFDNKKIEMKSVFSEQNFELLVSFIKQNAEKFNIKDSRFLFLYKFHLMGLEVQKMIDEAMEKSGLTNEYQIMQPDSGIHFLLHDIKSKDIGQVVVVCGNEIGDVLLEVLIHYYGLGTKETFFTCNYLLGKDIEVLQTMHGSADDLAGKEMVNPISTLKLSAYALENWLKVPNSRQKMEQVIKRAIQTKNVTRDMGGDKKTGEVVDYVLTNW